MAILTIYFTLSTEHKFILWPFLDYSNKFMCFLVIELIEVSYHMAVLTSGRAAAKRDVISANITLTTTYNLRQDDVSNVSMDSDDVIDTSAVLQVIVLTVADFQF